MTGLEAGGERIDQGDVVAAGLGGHGEADAALCAGLDLPATVLHADDVPGIVDWLVDSLDREAVVVGGEPERLRRVGHADAVVEAALAVLLKNQIRSGR